MLEQLEQVDGVQSAFANHAGSLVRVELDDDAQVDDVAAALTTLLEKQNRKPKQLSQADADKELVSGQWRKRENIGELSEIEFRTVFQRRVDEFVEAADLDDEKSAQILAFAQRVLDETPSTNVDTDFKEFCSGLADRMLDKSKAVLTEEQLQELGRKLKARVIG